MTQITTINPATKETAENSLVKLFDKNFRLIQKKVADKLELPIEIQLWGDHVYRLGKGDPAIKLRVEDKQGLAALVKLDELKICEAYMTGSLDVSGDMLGFASLRGILSDNHPLHSLWRRLAPLFVGRVQTDHFPTVRDLPDRSYHAPAASTANKGGVFSSSIAEVLTAFLLGDDYEEKLLNDTTTRWALIRDIMILVDEYATEQTVMLIRLHMVVYFVSRLY